MIQVVKPAPIENWIDKDVLARSTNQRPKQDFSSFRQNYHFHYLGTAKSGHKSPIPPFSIHRRWGWMFMHSLANMSRQKQQTKHESNEQGNIGLATFLILSLLRLSSFNSFWDLIPQSPVFETLGMWASLNSSFFSS